MQDEKDYRIAFVPEGGLPGDQLWAFIEYKGEMWLAIRRGYVTPDTLEECWAAFRKIAS